MFTLALEDIKETIPGLQLVCAPVTLTVNLRKRVSSQFMYRILSLSSGDTEVCEVYHGAAALICRSVHGSPTGGTLASSDCLLLISQQTNLRQFVRLWWPYDLKAKHMDAVSALLLS